MKKRRRYANAWDDCYVKLRNELVDEIRRNNLFQKLDEYERNGDPRVIENTTYTSRNMHVRFACEAFITLQK